VSRARDIANYGDGIDTSSITSGTFADARIAASNVTQHGVVVYLEKFTASSTSEKIFNLDSFTSYNSYIFEINTLRPADDNVTFRMVVGTSSSDSDMFDGVGENRTAMAYGFYDGSSSGDTSTNASDSLISSYGHGNDSDKGMSGTIHLYNPTSTTINTSAKAHVVNWFYTNFTQIKNIGGWRLGATDDAYIKFYFFGSNITSGTITLYGIKDA
tara:strand:+ start:1318 stop:1959 length:642 start_codon:yes stop_codon:yes gene_type:complete